MKQPSVAGIIFNESRDKVLLIKRRDVPVWVLPGGGLEKGETFETGAQRETEEETGLETRLIRLVGQFLPKNPLTRHTYLYEFKSIGGSFHRGSETLDIKYFRVDSLPRLMPPPYQEWIKEAHKNLPFPIEKITQSVSYLTLIIKFLKHPYLVSRHILSKLGFVFNKK